jgi:hypothetical protein
MTAKEFVRPTLLAMLLLVPLAVSGCYSETRESVAAVPPAAGEVTNATAIAGFGQ